MKPTPKSSQPFPRLADIEREVVAEAREWGRQRLEERLQQLADESGEVFPPPATPAKARHAPQRTGRDKTGG
jgi:hypothetical protein